MKKITLVIAITFALVSCKSENKDTGSTPSGCFKDFLNQYDKLLSKEELQSFQFLIDGDSDIEFKNSSSGYHRLVWNESKDHLGKKHYIEISGMYFYPEKEDLETIRREFDRQYKEVTNDERKQAELEWEKMLEEAERDGMKFFVKPEHLVWHPVEHFGSSAWYKWDPVKGGQLVVLSDRARFHYGAKINDDPNLNRDIATKLAYLTLEKCEN